MAAFDQTAAEGTMTPLTEMLETQLDEGTDWGEDASPQDEPEQVPTKLSASLSQAAKRRPLLHHRADGDQKQAEVMMRL